MIFDRFFGNTLYYSGCLTKVVAKEIGENYEEILRKVGVDFIKLSKTEVCCGSPALNGGYLELAKNLAKRNLKIFKQHSVKKIITSCPACFKTFSKEYPEILGEEWKIEVVFILQLLDELVRKGKIELKKIGKEKVTYHDPCHLGRYSKMYHEPRRLIERMGFKLVEMEFCKENSFCCGGGGGLRANFPELANAIAKDRLRQALKTDAKILITSCPLCYLHLKQNSSSIRVEEISNLLVKAIK